METWLKWLEGGMSLVGLAAIITWLFRWVNKYSSKQRELSQIDKEIRTALREALEGQKNLREQDRELSSRQIETLKVEIEAFHREVQARMKDLASHDKRNAIARLAAGIAAKMAQIRFQERIRDAVNTYFRAASFLIKERGVSPETVLRLFVAGFHDGELPTSSEERLFFYLTLQFRCAIQLGTALEISSSVVPALIEEYERNPNRSVTEIMETLGQKVRSGELDSDAAHARTYLIEKLHEATRAPDRRGTQSVDK